MPDKIEIRVAALVKKGDKVLLARHETGSQRYWVVPGGHLKFGETLSDAAERETLEETTLKLSCGELVFAADYIAADASRHTLNLFFEMTGDVPDDSKIYNTAHSDKKLCGMKFFSAGELNNLDIRPPIQKELTEYLQTGKVLKKYIPSR